MLRSSFEILGVPRGLVRRALEADALDTLASVIKRYHRVLLHEYHPDQPTGDAQLLDEVVKVYKQLQDPIALKFEAELYVKDGLAPKTAAASSKRQAQRDDRVREALETMLLVVDQQCILGASGPVRFFVGLDVSGSDFSGSYEEGLAGELSAHALTLARTLPIADPTGLDGADKLVFDGRPEFDIQENLWRDVAFVNPEVNSESRSWLHRQTVPLPSDIRLAGAVAKGLAADLWVSLYGARGSGPSARGALPGGRLQGLAWAPFGQCWWAPLLQPRAALGDHLVLVRDGESPLYTLTGRLLACEPM